MTTTMQLTANESYAATYDAELFGIDEAEASQSQLSRSAYRLRGLMRKSASKRGLLIVFRQLALLLETGIDVAEAIELAAASCRQPTLKQALLQVLEDIRKGNSLSLAVAEQEKILGCQVVASIQAGEVSGRLVDVLRQIATQLEDDLSMRATLVGALAYPAILAGASLVVGAILVWFVLPQFEESFVSMAITPPFFTGVLFALAGLVRNNPLFVAIGTIGSLVMLGFVSIQPEFRKLIYKLSFHSPIIGPTLRNLSVGQMFVSLGHLLANGISLLEAIQLMSKSTRGGVLGSLVEAWEHDVLEGRGLTYSLKEFDYLPEGAGAMLLMAERTGKLESVLTTAGAYYRLEGSTQLRQVLKLMEPLIIVLLGLFVGVVVASVLLPILDVQAGAAG